MKTCSLRFSRPGLAAVAAAALASLSPLLAALPEVQLVSSFPVDLQTPVAHNDLVLHPTDGFLYGTSYYGGSRDKGFVYRMDAAGVVEPMAHFSGNGLKNRGAHPYGRLTLGPDGRFYGTTYRGGASDAGTVYAVTTAGVLTTLAEFDYNGSVKGAMPGGNLAVGPDGRLYGMTARGGAPDYGTVFAVTIDGDFTSLAELQWMTMGGQPSGGLIAAADGMLYGMTTVGGNSYSGNIFRITTAGVLSNLITFNGTFGNLGSSPYGHLLQAADGHFYGMTYQGGTLNHGTIFKLDSGTLALTTLVEFTGESGPNKGTGPVGDLIQGADGALYGTTSSGGSLAMGTVFKVTMSGVLTTLADFTGAAALPGGSPQGTLCKGDDGRLYGLTSGGSGKGTIFVVNADDSVTLLRELSTNGYTSAGALPVGGLTTGPDGLLYGVTERGGTANYGTVFKLAANGVRTSLLSFTGASGAAKGESPTGLALGADGNFYGTTRQGGSTGWGTLFRLTPTGTFTTLVEFTGSSGALRGAGPHGGLILASDGHFYGTTFAGGSYDYGTVFRLTSAGVMTVLVDFTRTGAVPGATPLGPLLELADGYLYGTTYSGGADVSGTVFRISKTGTFESLLSFTGSGGAYPGSYPGSRLCLGRDGKLYGVTGGGGVRNEGSLFRMTPTGEHELLFEFDFFDPLGRPELGYAPVNGLHQGSDGFFYGMTAAGSPNNVGQMFQMSASGEVTLLQTFAGAGFGPESAARPQDTQMMTGSDGNIYAMTQNGGPGGAGTILRIVMPPPPRVRANIGQSVTVDLSFIPLGAGQTLRVTGLPSGLKLLPGIPPTISGIAYGPVAEGGVRVDVMAGKKVVRSLWLDLEIAPFGHLGSHEALLELATGEPIGKLRVTAASPTAKLPAPGFTATLEQLAQSRRSTKGSLPSATDALQTVVVTFTATRTQPALTVNVILNAASDLVTGALASEPTTTLRGFRLAKPVRIPAGNPRLTVAFDPDSPATDRSTGPAGIGHATGSVNGKAQVRLAGMLGDAQRFTATLALSQTQQAVVWLTPYRNKQSTLGGIISLDQLDLPGRGAPTEAQAAGLQWWKAANAAEKAYGSGFTAGIPLTARASRWYPVKSAEALAQSLGLTYRQIELSYLAPPSDELPNLLSLRDRYTLLRLLPNSAVGWTGKVNPNTGAFTGRLTLAPPALRSAVSGVLLQADTFGTRVGAGLIQIPILSAVRGGFETAGLELQQGD